MFRIDGARLRAFLDDQGLTTHTKWSPKIAINHSTLEGRSKDREFIMVKKRVPKELPTLRGQGADGNTAPSIQVCLDNLYGAFLQELDRILSSARNIERQTKEALAEGISFSKIEAAGFIGISVSSLERAVKLRKIVAKYPGRRPRFLLTEIIRFQQALPTAPPHKPRYGRKQ